MKENMEIKKFIINIILLLVIFIVFNFTNDKSLSIAQGIGEALGVVTGSFLWGLIIWAPIRIFGGKSKAPDIRKFTIITAYIVGTLYILMSIVK